MPDLGSPKLDDPTSELEKAVNRPFGSQKVPTEQLKMEHDNGVAAGGVQFYSQKLQEMVAQEGEQRGLEMFIDYTEAMTK
jgi:hypothetical protein